MSIVGKIVFHTSFGKIENLKGVIQALNADETIISIAFENDSKPRRRFLVPNSFDSYNGLPPKLVTQDPELLNWLNALRNRVCSICQSRSQKLIQYGDYLFCENCMEERFSKCLDCQKLLPKDQMEEFYDGFVCKSCYSKPEHSCKKCGAHLIDSYDGLCCDCKFEESSKQLYLQTFTSPSYFNRKICRIDGRHDAMKNLHTVPLMSRLNKSSYNDPFDILVLENYTAYLHQRYDLVIIPELPLYCNHATPLGCTMSQFKSTYYKRIQRYIEQLLLHDQCIDTALNEKEVFRLLPKARSIQAQTNSDRHYGDRRYGRYDCVEGNKYGDTSTFYIVGAIMRKSQTYVYKAYRYQNEP